MEALIAIGLFIVVQIVKRKISPKWGPTGVHVFIFLIALIVYGVYFSMTIYPGFKQLVMTAGEFLVGSMAVYEILWKRIADKIALVD